MRRTILSVMVLSVIALSPFAFFGVVSTPVYGSVGPRLKLDNARPGPSGIVATEIPGEEVLGPPSEGLPLVGGPVSGSRSGGSSYIENIVFNLDTTFLPQNEPWVVINPNNKEHIVAGANDYRRRFTPTAGTSFIIGSGIYVSFDGGETVLEGTRPSVVGVTPAIPGILFPIDHNIPPPGIGGDRAYQGAGDPAIDFDAFGRVYYAMLGFHFDAPIGPFVFDNGIFVFRSTDGGLTWSQQLEVSELTPPAAFTLFEDKEFIAVDKRTSGPNAGYIAVTWTRFEFTPAGAFVSAKILLSISTNQGTTWSSPVIVSDSIANQFSTPFIDENGDLFVAWADFDAPGAIFKVRKAASEGSLSLGAVHEVVELPFEHFIGFGAPLPVDQTIPVAGPQDRIPRIATYPKFAIDTSESDLAGRFYVTWDAWSSASQQLGFHDGEFWARGSDIFLRFSDDQGATWSSTIQVNQDAAGGNDQLMPALAVDPADGSVHASFYDARDDPANRLLKQVVATSEDGGETFDEIVVSVPFDNPGVPAPNSLTPPIGVSLFDPSPIEAIDISHDIIFGARFFGDYNGLAVLDDNVFVIWADTRAIKRGPTRLAFPTALPSPLTPAIRGPFFQEDGILATLEIGAAAED